MKDMNEIFELLKYGKLDELTYRFDLEGVASEVEYTLPLDAYNGMLDNFKILPFLGGSHIMGEHPSFSFTYNGRSFKINKATKTEFENIQPKLLNNNE